MAVSYEEALSIIRNVAEKYKFENNGFSCAVPLLESLGRVATKNHVSSITTPAHDTSAMDGYALSSEATREASIENPVMFIIKGTIAAGDYPIELANQPEDGAFPCVEIMTGARFPSTTSTPFDACVKIEDTTGFDPFDTRSGLKPYKQIAVTRPLRLNTNRRFAGGDMRAGDVILREGDVVCPRHLMALASVGITKVDAHCKLRVAVWSTGNELSERSDMRNDSQIWNSNGPFLTASLQELGVDVDYRGILKDDPESLQTALGSCGSRPYDLVITTGAVSKGKFDFIVPALEELQAEIHFHGVAMRPGHPVLFATMRSNTGSLPIFGLPGNPIATAACFRFLVEPFLEDVLGRKRQQPEYAQLVPSTEGGNILRSSPAHLDCFKHGFMQRDSHGRRTVELSVNQSPAVISQFATSNCWVHIPRGHQAKSSLTQVPYYSHNSAFL